MTIIGHAYLERTPTMEEYEAAVKGIELAKFMPSKKLMVA